jgi:hypothetical protein
METSSQQKTKSVYQPKSPGLQRVKTFEDTKFDPKEDKEFKFIKDNKRRSMSVDSGTISLLIQEVSAAAAYINDEKQGALKKQRSSEELDPLNIMPALISSLKTGE